MARPALLVLLASDAVAAAHAWTLNQTLPAVVASHFDAAGRVNGWMPRGAFVGFYAGVVAFLTVIFVGVSFTMRVPGIRLNLPNRDHWLAPERRDATLAWLGAWSYWMASIIVWLMIGIMRLAARANLGDPGAMASAPILLAAFGAATALLLAAMLVHFYNPDSPA